MLEVGPPAHEFPGAVAVGMSKLSVELADALDRRAAQVPLEKGTVLFHSGDVLSGVFVIRKGAVTLSVDAKNSPYPSSKLGPGEIVGLPATLTGHYSLTARVVEDSEFGFIAGGEVTQMLESSPRLCMIAMRLMSEEIARIRDALRETPSMESGEEC
jgi:CRP-like cAMP-binding protein